MKIMKSENSQALENFKARVAQFEEAYSTGVAILCFLSDGEKHEPEEIARGFGKESAKYLGLLSKSELVNHENGSYTITALGKTALNFIETNYTP